MKNRKLRVAVHQIEVRYGALEENFGKIRRCLAEFDADIHIFPEASTSGFQYHELVEISRKNGEFLKEIRDFCQIKKTNVALPLLMGENGSYFNRIYPVFFDRPDIEPYSKVHLIGVLNEDRYLAPGTKALVANFSLADLNIRIGFAICYDLRFPELFRTMCLKHSADIFILSSQWPVERRDHFPVLSRARAIENQTPLIACNAVNRSGRLKLCGNSAAYNARGEVLAEASGDAEVSFIVELDLNETEIWRKEFPVLKDANFLGGLP